MGHAPYRGIPGFPRNPPRVPRTPPGGNPGFPGNPPPAENGIEQRDHDQTVACTPEGAEHKLFVDIIIIKLKTGNELTHKNNE